MAMSFRSDGALDVVDSSRKDFPADSSTNYFSDQKDGMESYEHLKQQ